MLHLIFLGHSLYKSTQAIFMPIFESVNFCKIWLAIDRPLESVLVHQSRKKKLQKKSLIEWIFTIFGMPQKEKNVRNVNKIIKSEFLSVKYLFE